MESSRAGRSDRARGVEIKGIKNKRVKVHACGFVLMGMHNTLLPGTMITCGMLKIHANCEIGSRGAVFIALRGCGRVAAQYLTCCTSILLNPPVEAGLYHTENQIEPVL